MNEKLLHVFDAGLHLVYLWLNLNLKSDKELFSIYKNAVRYSLENIYLLVKELKARFRTDNLEVINDFINKLN